MGVTEGPTTKKGERRLNGKGAGGGGGVAIMRLRRLTASFKKGTGKERSKQERKMEKERKKYIKRT